MPNPLERNLESVIIGPALVTFGGYIAPFATSRLISSEDQIDASLLGAGVGFVLSVALRAVLTGTSYRTRKIAIITSLVITIILLVYCYRIWILLAQGLGRLESEGLKNQQFLIFVAAMSFLCLTLSLSPLAYPDDYSKFKVFIIIAVIIIVGLLAFYFWHHYQ